MTQYAQPTESALRWLLTASVPGATGNPPWYLNGFHQVFVMHAPQLIKPPFLVLRRASTKFNGTLSPSTGYGSTLTQAEVEVACLGSSYEQAIKSADFARLRADGYRGSITITTSGGTSLVVEVQRCNLTGETHDVLEREGTEVPYSVVSLIFSMSITTTNTTAFDPNP